MGVCFSNKKFILTDTINININTNRNQMNKSMSYQFDESKSGNIKPSAFIKKKTFFQHIKRIYYSRLYWKRSFWNCQKSYSYPDESSTSNEDNFKNNQFCKG